jgi:hypothetical protein
MPRRDPILELPPKIPADGGQLDRAIKLLGERAKAELTSRVRTELIELLGKYPNAKEAADWKRALKSTRLDEIFERAG